MGYFGHMWELYAFWALIIFYLAERSVQRSPLSAEQLYLITFLTIGIGGLGCFLGGWISRYIGETYVALFSLAGSCLCCFFSGLFFELPAPFFLALVLLWGVLVISDSPQFSALAAVTCPPDYTGTALTIQNGIGFGITVISIQLTALISQLFGWQWSFTFLVLGPLAGIASLLKLRNKHHLR